MHFVLRLPNIYLVHLSFTTTLPPPSDHDIATGMFLHNSHGIHQDENIFYLTSIYELVHPLQKKVISLEHKLHFTGYGITV